MRTDGSILNGTTPLDSHVLQTQSASDGTNVVRTKIRSDLSRNLASGRDNGPIYLGGDFYVGVWVSR